MIRSSTPALTAVTRIALVDDHDLVRGGFELLLARMLGYRVVASSSSGPALLDAQGRSVLTRSSSGDPALSIGVKDWSEGLYLARVVAEDFTIGECKFTVLK